MKRSIAELITRDPEKFAHHDRVFKNNPVVMQGMGLAPLVVLATTGKNALMLAVAVALLLTPSRMLACLVSRLFPLRDEQPAPEELEKKLLPRALVYSGSAAVVYLAAYPILNAVFGTDLLMLGIYLPMLVVEPLLTYRFGRVQESMHKAVSKGLRITVGYALILFIVGLPPRFQQQSGYVRGSAHRGLPAGVAGAGQCVWDPAQPFCPAHGIHAGRRFHRAGRGVCRLARAGPQTQGIPEN